MQRIANCILLNKESNKALLLKKPSRGWWVAPGGKMEQGETVTQSVIREYKEETGLLLKNPTLRGIFTIIIEDSGKVMDEWMMFTFVAEEAEGEQLAHSPEGELSWIDIPNIHQLPKAEGDQLFFDHLLTSNEMLYMTFRYTPEYKLLAYQRT